MSRERVGVGGVKCLQGRGDLLQGRDLRKVP